MSSKKTMEVNPQHPIVRTLVSKMSADASDSTVKDLVWLLYECALLDSGFTLPKPATFTGRIHRLISLGLGVEDADAGDDDEDDGIEVPGEEEPGAADEGGEASTMEEVD